MPKIARNKVTQSLKKPYRRPEKVFKPPKYETLTYQQREVRIKEALNAYHDPKDEDISSLEKASSIFDVPPKTLWNRDHGTESLAENGGHNTKLNEAQEATLIWYCDLAIERGFPLNYEMIVAAATKIKKAAGFDMALEKNRFGTNWVSRWVKKQNKLGRYHGVKTKPMDHRRREAVTPELIRSYFEKLRLCLLKYNIHISDIYNVDETGFRVGCITSTVARVGLPKICTNFTQF